MTREPNVLLIILDSVRAQNLSAYGYPELTTPFLESIQGDVIQYSNARAPGTWSLPSHVSLFTGVPVHEHGFTSHDQQLKPGHTVWEQLSDEGYRTGVFSSNPFITEDTYGLQYGFDTIERYTQSLDYPFETAATPREFENDGTSPVPTPARYAAFCARQPQPFRSLLNGAYQKTRSVTVGGRYAELSLRNESDEVAETFLEWERRQDGPWAACINLMDAHYPYVPEAEHDAWGTDTLHQIQKDIEDTRWDFYASRRPWSERRALEALYDGCIRQLDQTLEKLVSSLKQRGSYEDTLVVVTSDHGEGFGEYSRVRRGFRTAGHRMGVHEVVLHVPLFVKPPSLCPDEVGKRESRLATITRFPDAVAAAIDGEPLADAFVQSEVYAGANYDDAVEYFLEKFDIVNRHRDVLSLDMFAGEVRIQYTQDSGKVRKHVLWGDDEATIDIYGLRNAARVRAGLDEETRDHLQNLTPRRITTTTEETLSTQADARLQALGYK